MKSISEVVEYINFDKSASKEISLISRPLPLDATAIEKLNEAIDRFFVVKKQNIYGYRPVVVDGQYIRDEYDIIGEETSFEPKEITPQALIDAMLRPAQRQHIIYHLGRLATHRRDTRGQEAFQVILEDVASDLVGVSEWAVVLACKEMREKEITWFPNSGELMNIIKKHDRRLKNINYLQLENFKGDNMKLNRADYYNDPKDNPIRRILCDYLVSKGEEDHFNDVMWSNYQLELHAMKKHGYSVNDNFSKLKLQIEEVKKMIKIAKENPTVLNLKKWQDELTRLEKELPSPESILPEYHR